MKLIAIDLDGTLLSGNKMISKENAEAIRKCQEASMLWQFVQDVL